MQTDTIERHPDGSINHDFYRKAAKRLRAQAVGTFPPGKRVLARALIATAMILGPVGALIAGPLAVAGIVQILKGDSSAAAAATTLRLAQRAR